jgi:hypothetical protein
VGDKSEIPLKASPGTGTSSFWFSLDNRTFVKLGNDLHMRFNLKVFTGNKFCLFNYATSAPGGFVDFDWFRTEASARSDSVPEDK